MRARPCAVVTFALRFPVNFVHIPLSVCTRAQDHAKAMDEHSVLTDRTRAAPFPRGVAIARLLLGIESAWWLLLGTLLVVGGLIVLRGGSGLPGIVNDPPGDPPIGGWVVEVGIVIATMGGWGLWTVGSRWLLTRTMFISALLFCVVWIAIGVLFVRIATTPIPGIVTVTVNAVIFIALVSPSSSRATFRRTTTNSVGGDV